jgi:hypothetical protein
MSNLEYIVKKFKNNETAYLLNDYEDIVIKLVPNKSSYKCFAKFKGKSMKDVYEINRTTNLVVETELGGKVITEKAYDRY